MVESELGLEMLADKGVEKGAQDFKVSSRKGSRLLWLEREPGDGKGHYGRCRGR